MYPLDGEFIETKYYYLRYDNERSSIKSRIMNGGEIVHNKRELKEHSRAGFLRQIEDVIETIAGGALYVYGNIIYGEYCEGHPIILLRKGLCGKRFLITDDGISELPAQQQWIARQKITGGYEWLPFNGVMTSEYTRIIDCIRSKSRREQGLLMEYLLEKDRIIFCDAKVKDFGIPAGKWADMFFRQEASVPLKGCAGIGAGAKIDGFDIDAYDAHKPPLPERLCVHNGAFLSHYITYHIQQIPHIFLVKHMVPL
jgi:hypothetical protein